jgi:predicted Zn finger-like uncharacterized protein
MYTQCPECHVAFRVTAEILKQAAGKVRCGGCGVAFNALEYLSEHKPLAPVRDDPQPQLPELRPDEPGEVEADDASATISAEQSAALLETLDQLAGDDIRIEDTGVEWRVVGADETEDDAGEAEPTSELQTAEEEHEEAGSTADSGSFKFFIDDGQGPAPLDEVLEESPTPVDEILTAAPTDVDAPEIFEEMRFDDNTPLPDDFGLEAPAAPPGPDIEMPESVEPPEAAQVDLELGDPGEWEELLDEVGEPEAVTIEPDSPAVEDAQAAMEELLDVDTQFALQAEALGISASGRLEAIDESLLVDEETAMEAAPADEEPKTSIDEDLIAAAFQSEAAAHAGFEPEPEHETVQDRAPESSTAEPGLEAETDDDDEDIPIELQEPDDDAELMTDFRETPVDERSLEIRLDGDDLDEDDEDTESRDSGEHFVPEMTEEEKTINMLIDQDLLSIAVEDEAGLAATVVQVQPDREAGKAPADPAPAIEEEGSSEVGEAEPAVAGTPLIETIIMEGEAVRGPHDGDRHEQNRRLGEELKARQAEEELRKEASGRTSRWGAIAAAILLILALVLQFVHHSRDALATIPVFHETVGPIYHMLGRPLTPAWNIKGWRFEATKGSTDDAGERLTIYSRVGNNSDAPLPYPLVHVSLTDRFEDIIGSRVLEPAEYLGKDADPRELVPAGNTFNAAISIEAPSSEATGFKLNVCYRLASGQLRCALEDFK